MKGAGLSSFLPPVQLVVTLPTDARILPVELAWESIFAGLRYAGRVEGHIFVLMQNSISDTSQGHALLSAFRDYDPNGWERKSFTDMSVFYQ